MTTGRRRAHLLMVLSTALGLGTGLLGAGPAGAAPDGSGSAVCPPLLPMCLAADVAGDAAGALGTGVGGVVESAAEAMLAVVAQGFLEAYLIVFRYATTWWLDIDMSPTSLVGAVDSDFRSTIAYIAAFVMVLALLSAAIQTMWRRDGTVVADAATGVFKAVLVIFGAWGVLGVLWTLSDQLTDALAPNPGNIDVDPILALGAVVAGPGLAILVIIVSLVGFVMSLGVALLMVFRLASAVVLALLLPIAAAGAPGTSTRGWLPKVTGWLMALIFLRPMVAAIYRIGFEFVAGGNDPANADLIQQMSQSGDPGTVPQAAADGLMTLLVGVMTLLVAVFALPVLLKLFSWIFGGGAVGMGGGGLAMAGLGMQGAMLRGRGQGASAHADRMAQDLGGGSGGGAGGGAPTGSGGGGAPLAGPAGGGSPSIPLPGAGGGAAAAGASAGAGAAGGAAAGGGAAAAGAGAGAAAGAAGGPPGMVAGAVLAGGVMKAAGTVKSAAEGLGAAVEEDMP